MVISFDPVKNNRNLQQRGLPFTMVQDLQWSSAFIEEDKRRDYGERRYRVFGYINQRLYAIVFTPRNNKVHVISLRKANAREVTRYEHITKSTNA